MALLNENIEVIILDQSKTSVIELTKVDLFHSEEHDASYQLTSFPIEDGSNRSDNVIKMPEKITLKGVTSNSGVLDGTGSSGTLSRVNDAWQQIKQIADNKQQVTVVTLVNIYTNMTITRANIPSIDRTSGQNMIFTLTLEETPVVLTSKGQITSDKTSSDNNPAKNMTDQINNGDKQTTNNDVNQSTLDKLL